MNDPDPKPKKKWRRRLMRTAVVTAVITSLVSAAGCIRIHANTPSFDLNKAEVLERWDELETEPIDSLDRPVVLLSGYRAWPSMVGRLERRLARLTTGDKDDFLAIAYPDGSDIDEIIETVVAEVEEAYPSDDPSLTTRVDVVAISMGGLVARAAADNPDARGRSGKRLNIDRLYTIASPHRGATLADIVALDTAAKSMKPGSAWLNDLNSRTDERAYELVCYGQLRDGWVGATNTAPPGMEPYWTGGTLLWSHFAAPTNPWFIVDIASRLRGDDPIGVRPAAPPRN